MSGYKTLQDEFSERIGSEYTTDKFDYNDTEQSDLYLSSADNRMDQIRNVSNKNKKNVVHNFDDYQNEYYSTDNYGTRNNDSVYLDEPYLKDDDLNMNNSGVTIGEFDNRVLPINYYKAKKCKKQCLLRNKNTNNICAYCRQIALENRVFNNDKQMLKRELIEPIPQYMVPRYSNDSNDSNYNNGSNGKQKMEGIKATKKKKKQIIDYTDLNKFVDSELDLSIFDKSESYRSLSNAEIADDDPEAMQWQYKFINPDEVPAEYRNAEAYSQYSQIYYDNNDEADGSFPFRYAYTNRGKKPQHLFVPDHKLLTL